MFRINNNKIILVSIISIIILFSIFTITQNISKNTSFDIAIINEINQVIDAKFEIAAIEELENTNTRYRSLLKLANGGGLQINILKFETEKIAQAELLNVRTKIEKSDPRFSNNVLEEYSSENTYTVCRIQTLGYCDLLNIFVVESNILKSISAEGFEFDSKQIFDLINHI